MILQIYEEHERTRERENIFLVATLIYIYKINQSREVRTILTPSPANKNEREEESKERMGSITSKRKGYRMFCMV